MTKIYQFNFDRGHAYSIGEGFGADSLEGIGFLNFPQGYAYMRDLIYREDGWVRPPFSIGNYHSAAGTGALKGVYFAIDGLYAYTGNNQLLFSQGGNGDWQTANWVGTGSEPAIGVDANRNIQWFDNYGLPLFTSPVATEPVFWTYQKQDIFGDIDIPPTDTGGEPVPDPPIIPPTNPYVNPYPNAQYYYHNAGRTNWVRGVNKNFSPKGTGQVYKTFDAGEAIGLAEGGNLYGYPKVYSLPSCDQTGEDLPEDFIPWDDTYSTPNSVGIFNGVRNCYYPFALYDYINYNKTQLESLVGYSKELYNKDYSSITFEKTTTLATFRLYNWNNEIIKTVTFSDFDETLTPKIYLRPESWAIDRHLDQNNDMFINCHTEKFETMTPEDIPPSSTPPASYESNYYTDYVDVPITTTSPYEEKNWLYSGSGWELVGSVSQTYSFTWVWFFDYQYMDPPWDDSGWTNPVLLGSGRSYAKDFEASINRDGYYDYIFMYFGDTMLFGRHKYGDSPATSLFEGFSLTPKGAIITKEPFEVPTACSNNDNAFKFVSFSGKSLTYKTVNIDGTDTDKTITLPLSANSSNFQLKESVITDDNIVYFVYHDLTNSKIGIIGIDIIENLVYYSYEENCTSFPTYQKLFHYGSYIGFKTQNNWKIIN